jgi:hypothetical protein
VFLNDGSGAKLGYYLRQSAKLSVAPQCRADGRRELRLRVTLRSAVPRRGLSPYVLGLGLAGDPYTVRTVVSIYSPSGGSLMGMRLDGAPRSFGAGADGPRSVGMVAVDLKPGAAKTLEATLLTGVPPAGDDTVAPQLWTTPAVTAWHKSVETADGCGSGR